MLLDVDLELEVVEENQITEAADPGPLRTAVSGLQVRLEFVELRELFLTFLFLVAFLVDAVIDFVVGGHVICGLGGVSETLFADQASDPDVTLALVLGFDMGLK